MATTPKVSQHEDVEFLRKFLGTNIEDLRGDDELSSKLAWVQYGLANYHENGGRFFGHPITKDISHVDIHYPNRGDFPDVILVEITLGDRTFLACQRFKDLHPYSQLVLRALDGLDVGKPMCTMLSTNMEEWENFWAKKKGLKYIPEDALFLYHTALLHLVYLLTPEGDLSNPYIEAAHYEVLNALSRHPVYNSSGKLHGTLLDLTKEKVVNRMNEYADDFIKLTRCPYVYGLDRSRIHIAIGHSKGRVAAAANYPVNEPSFVWHNKAHLDNPQVRFTTGNTFVDQVDDMQLMKRLSGGRNSIPWSVAIMPISVSRAQSIKFVHLCILHPEVNFEITIPVTEITASIGNLLDKLFHPNNSSVASVAHDSLMQHLQEWFLVTMQMRVVRVPLNEIIELTKLIV